MALSGMVLHFGHIGQDFLLLAKILLVSNESINAINQSGFQYDS